MKKEGKKNVRILYIGNLLTRYGFTPGVIDTLGPLLEREGYIVDYAGACKNQFWRLLDMLWKTLTIGRKVNYIIIDTYSTSAYWYAYFTSVVARMIETPYIPLLHGGDLPKRLKQSKRISDSLFNNSYANIAVSAYLKHEFEKAGYKTIVIPNSIDISKYPFKFRDQPRPKLLWVRSFHQQYNPNMAADVLKELLKSHPDSELCMVGPDKDGSMQEFRNYIETLGIGDHVKITGLLKKEEWIKLSDDYDFVINTTNVDNTPVSVIEAMALGLCVISTNPDGIPYLLNDSKDSMLVMPGDYSTMAKHICTIIKKPGFAKQLSTNARSKAESFDWVILREKWIRLLSPVDK